MKLTLTSGFTWFPPTHWRALLCLGTDTCRSMALPAWLSLPDPSLHLKPTKTSTAARVAANIPAIFTISASSVPLLQLLITRPPRGAEPTTSSKDSTNFSLPPGWEDKLSQAYQFSDRNRNSQIYRIASSGTTNTSKSMKTARNHCDKYSGPSAPRSAMPSPMGAEYSVRLAEDQNLVLEHPRART